MAHYEITNRGMYSSVRFYDRDPDRYVASFQAEFEGDSAFIHTLCGNTFYVHLKKWIHNLYADLGLTSVHFDMLPDHLRIAKRILRNVAEFEVLGEVIDSGRCMEWVKMTLKEKIK